MPSHTDWNITVVTQCRSSSAAGSLVGWLAGPVLSVDVAVLLLIVTTANRLPTKSFHVYEYYHSCNYNMRAFIGKLAQPPPSMALCWLVGWCTRTIIWPIIQITLSVRGIGYGTSIVAQLQEEVVENYHRLATATYSQLTELKSQPERDYINILHP